RQESITAGVESIAFTLATESVVAGTVVTDDGERTVADAKVTLRNSTSSELFEAVTDERGVFEVRGLPAGRYFLVVDHEEFAPALGLEIGVREAARLTARTVRLRRGFAISGTVLEAKTLKPVPLARVTGQLADATARPRILRSGETGIDGRFEFEGFVGGAYLITVTAPDHVPSPPERVALVPDGKRQFTLLLARGGSISGRVLDRQGKPVVGATLDLRPALGASAPSPLEQGEQEESVQFVRISQRGTLMSEVTDDQGSYRFSGVPPGREYSLSLYHWKYAPLLVPRFEVGPGKATDDLDLTLRRGAVLRGRVLDERGRGIVSATVKAVLEMKQTARARQVAGALESALRMETHSLMTDSEGNYVISGLRPGTYRVIAKIANRLPYAVAGVDVVEVEVLEVVDIVLEPGESFAGQVVDSHGNPIAGVDIRAYDENSTRAATDLEGRFRLDGLPPSRVAVTAEKTGFVTARVVATAPDDTLLVRMERSATIRGAVVASRSGKPVPGARLILQAAAAPGSPAVRQVMAVTSRTDGTFLLERVPAGRYQLVASHPVHAQVLVPEFSLTAGKTRELLVELPGPLR
ncbi:MAG: carboxypeptidase-like regulatory domain-containing protein, partial [Planctomycetota bacterium]|nr:carboxypeptidase-like regulatory domain-containing protein [Planctomycetota bacterium]